MAYSRKTNATNATWKKVSGMDGFTVIGTKERFSISYELTSDFRFTVNGCRVVNGKDGEFISFPSWKDKDGNYHQYCYFTFKPFETKMLIDALA